MEDIDYDELCKLLRREEFRKNPLRAIKAILFRFYWEHLYQYFEGDDCKSEPDGQEEG